MIVYRMTRPNAYGVGTPGHLELSARQGYYIRALSEAEAHREMRERFPYDSHFDLQVWSEEEASYGTVIEQTKEPHHA